MKKLLLSAAVVVAGFSAQAQVDTLTEFFTGAPILYGVTGQGGYVTGNNGYGDLGKYQRFDSSTGMSVAGTMTGALLWIPAKDDAGGSLDVKVYDFAGGTAGAELGSVTIALSSIDTAVASAQIAEGAVVYNVAVTFPTPIALTPGADVVVGVALPTTAGDTVGIVSNTNGDVSNGETHTWEVWDDNSWNSMGTSWANQGTPLNIAMAIFPIVDGVASLSEPTIAASVYPNPALNELNIQIEGEATQVTVIAMDGKQVISEAINGASVTLNVADLNEGVYFYVLTAADGSIIRDTFVKK